MILADVVEQKKEALRVEDVARILDISVKQIYKMPAKGQIPSLKIANCVRFDPHDVAVWLRGQSCTNPTAAISLQNQETGPPQVECKLLLIASEENNC